jgi:hypothetical protein
MADASWTRSQKDFATEAEARSASDRLAREMISQGYAESGARSPMPANAIPAALKAAPSRREHDGVGPNRVLKDAAPASVETPWPPPLASAPTLRSAEQDAPLNRTKKKGSKNKKKARNDDELDKRVLAGIAAFGLALVGVVAFVVYDFFIKPPSIVGVWRGGMIEHEISRSLTLTQYDLVLDDKRRAALTVERVGRGRSPWSARTK